MIRRLILLTATVLLGLGAVSVYADDAPAPLPEAKSNNIGYPDVATARKALLARKDAKAVTTPNGWLIITIDSEMTEWSFNPESDPAYPAAVERIVTQDSTGVYVTMNVLCEASKQACDDLVRQFQKLNDQMKHPQGSP